MSGQVNPFADGISLKVGCGCCCKYTRCTLECERAQIISGDKTKLIIFARRKLDSLIIHGESKKAVDFLKELEKSKLISKSQSDTYYAENFN